MDGVPIKQLSPSKASILKAQFSKQDKRSSVWFKWRLCPRSRWLSNHFLSAFLGEEDLLVFYNEIHANGVILRESGASFIALIPKQDGACKVLDPNCVIRLINCHVR